MPFLWVPRATTPAGDLPSIDPPSSASLGPSMIQSAVGNYPGQVSEQTQLGSTPSWRPRLTLHCRGKGLAPWARCLVPRIPTHAGTALS